MSLLVGALITSCGSDNGEIKGDDGASCEITEAITPPNAVEVTLKQSSEDVGNFSPVASVSIGGGAGAESPSRQDYQLNTPIPLPSQPGTYVVDAIVAHAASAPPNYMNIECSTLVTIS